jgi:hypothetical protein
MIHLKGKIMKKILVIVIIIAAVIFLIRFFSSDQEGFWTCDKKTGLFVKQGNPSYPKPVISCPNTNSLPKTKEDCLAQDGIWKKQGPEPFETCNRKAVDRGNLCRDNNECEGMCQVELTKEELSQGMRGKLDVKKKYGQCSVWVVELGCRGMMKQGKPQVICID